MSVPHQKNALRIPIDASFPREQHFSHKSQPDTQHFEDNTWIHAKGKIAVQYHKNLGQSLPILKVSSFEKVEKPDNPYVYRVF